MFITNPHHKHSFGVIVAATTAAFSIAWISSRRWKARNDEILAALNHLSKRIEDIEADKIRKEDNSRRRISASNNHDRPKLRSLNVTDTDKNIKPSQNIFEDEDSFDNVMNHPPKSITTKRNLSMLVNEHSTYLTRRASFESAEQFNPENSAVPIVLISDPGQDLDDEMMFIMARYLVSLDLISLKGVVANLSPSFARARLTRGTLDLLGLHRVPVGIGTDGGDTKGKHSSDQFEESAASYIVQENGEAARGLESGHRLLQRLYEEAADIEYIEGNEMGKNSKDSNRMIKGGLTLVVTSSMKDAAIFVRDNPSLFASKTREVVVMGGCKPILSLDSRASTEYGMESYWSKLSKVECEPDSANNNTFDAEAADFFYSQCQKMNITFTVVTRFAAYAAKMPRSVYDDLALTGSSIGWRLRNSQRSSIDQLWQRACSQDKAVRAGLPPRCDRKWFISTFCGGEDDESRCCVDTAWDLVTGFMQYDTLALLAAVPVVREKHFDPVVLPPLERKSLRNSMRRMSTKSGESSGTEGASNITNKTRNMDNLTNEDKADSSTFKNFSRRHSSNSDPGPDALLRAIAQANDDNKKIEPFLLPRADEVVAFGSGTRNIIGSEKEHNLKDPDLLVKLLSTAYTKGILQNHHTQPHIILHMHLRWDNLADTLLTCLMLRSLWDLRLASVLGVIVSVDPSDSNDKHSNGGNSDESKSTLSALALSIQETLSSIGLAHVTFLVVSGDKLEERKKRATEAFLELYESAPPIGVTLVLTSTFSSVWPFAESHPELFRDKTVRVVHTGGALIWPGAKSWAKLPFSTDNDEDNGMEEEGDLTEEKILVPDPGSQNHRLDLDSANKFYRRVQALSVPMVILSRHVAMECCIPINFFDALGSHGGEVGLRIYQNERKSLEKLWRCSSAPSGSSQRGNLPDRCDMNWFSDTFCAGRQVNNEEDVWKSVESVNVYSPLALLAALPGETLRSYFRTMPFPVRSATHHIVGLTDEIRNVRNPSELRSLIVQALLSAAIANDSVFGKNPPPKIPIRMDHEQRSRDCTLRDSILGNSVDSSVSSSKSADEYDVWTFSEAARRELFNKTLVRSAKVAEPKQRRRRFILATESRIAACSAVPESREET